DADRYLNDEERTTAREHVSDAMNVTKHNILADALLHDMLFDHAYFTQMTQKLRDTKDEIHSQRAEVNSLREESLGVKRKNTYPEQSQTGFEERSKHRKLSGVVTTFT
ncbi:MAG: hypothetical protein Q9180_004250, partial [Flavoplaca navasiana]